MNTPTKITLSRIVLIVATLIGLFVFEVICQSNPSIFLGFDFYLGNTEINLIYFIVCIVFIIASLTDMLDGYLARKHNQVTDLGKFLDPVADKLLVNSMLIYLCINRVGVYTTADQYIIPVYLVIIMVARDIIVDCLRFIAAKKNIVIAANIFGKAKTVSQMISIPLVLLNGWPFYHFDLKWGNQNLRIVAFFMYVTTFLSLLSGIIYVIQNRKVFTTKVDNTSKLVNTLIKKNLTIGAVESLTGGEFISTLINIPGASKVVRGGLTTYQAEFKSSLLKISKKDIDKYTVVSKEIAKEMVVNGSKLLNSDIVVSFTGNAGPSVDKNTTEVGRVYIGLLFKKNKEKIKIFSKLYKGDRNTIRTSVIEDTIDYILKEVGEAK